MKKKMIAMLLTTAIVVGSGATVVFAEKENAKTETAAQDEKTEDENAKDEKAKDDKKAVSKDAYKKYSKENDA